MIPGKRLVGAALTAVFATVLVYTGLYWWAMATFEGQSVSFLHSLQVVLEALTTTGFGADSPWDSAVVERLVRLIDVTGMLLTVAVPLSIVLGVRRTIARDAKE